MTPTTVYVALGSSLGDRAAHLHTGLQGLRDTPGVTLGRASQIYETAPVGGVAERRFLNAALELAVTSAHTPLSLLDRLLAIEQTAGRTRTLRWEDRTLDLDLLLWGDRIIDEPRLQVPHPRLHERRFVLQPLCDLAPALIHPRLGAPLCDLLAALHDDPADVQPVAASAEWPAA